MLAQGLIGIYTYFDETNTLTFILYSNHLKHLKTQSIVTDDT